MCWHLLWQFVIMSAKWCTDFTVFKPCFDLWAFVVYFQVLFCNNEVVASCDLDQIFVIGTGCNLSAKWLVVNNWVDEIPERFSTHEGMLLMDDSLVSLVNFTRNESVSEDDCHANCESSFCGDKKYSQVCETERSVRDELMFVWFLEASLKFVDSHKKRSEWNIQILSF